MSQSKSSSCDLHSRPGSKHNDHFEGFQNFWSMVLRYKNQKQLESDYEYQPIVWV